MKNYLHKLMALVLFVVGAQAVNAYSVADLEAAGWTKVEAISNVDDYYYVFVDAGSSAYMMVDAHNRERAYYRTLSDPITYSNSTWVLEAVNDGSYALKNAVTSRYYNSGDAGWNTYLDAANANANYKLTFVDGRYDIQSVKTSLYLGPWNDDGAVAGYGEAIAANKAPEDAPGFVVYSMERALYDNKLVTVFDQVTNENPVDLTSRLDNPGMDMNVEDWTVAGAAKWGNFIGYDDRRGIVEFCNWGAAWEASIEQTMTSLPNGKYIVKVAGQAAATNVVQTLTANGVSADLNCIGDVGGNIKADGSVVQMGGGIAGWQYMEVTCMVIDGTLAIKVNSSATTKERWGNVDNFSVLYVDPTIGEKAVTLPADGNLVADQWYVLDIATAGDYGLSATEGIVYTQDANALYSQIEASAAAETLTLAAGKLFVKSATAQTLTVTPKTFAYEVGAGSSAIEKKYLQTLSEVVVNFADAATNDPDAVLALLVDDAVATLKKGDEVVASGALAVEGKALKATFAEVNLELGSAYTIEVPADVFGYEGKATNEAIVVNFYTPAVPDGVYYLRNVTAGTYLSRGKAYGTQAVMDNFGLALNVVTDKEGRTTFQYFDNKQYLGDDNLCYADTDGDRKRSYIATAVEGGYKLQNTTNQLYLAEADGVAVGNAAVDGANIVWQMETSAQHVANYTAQVDAQAAAVAVAAGLEGIATAAALEELLAQYGTVSIPVTGASGEKYEKYAGHGADGAPASYHKETIEDLEPGIYKLTVEAFQRATWNDVVAAADGARGAVYVYAGEAKTQVKSVMEYGADAAYSNDFSYAGKHYPNDASSAQVALATGNYTNVVYVYVADAGEGKGSLTIGMENPNWANNIGTWVYYADYKLTRYTDNKVTAEEIEAFEKALAAVEKYTLGFAAGEYAPYTNVEAVKVIAAAKAIDLTTASSEPVVKATADLVALETYEWTVNEKEMNAIYDGSFEYDYSAIEGNVKPLGWNRTSGTNTGYEVRYITNVPEGATSSNKGMFIKFTANYGRDAGYTMPLKAKSAYALSFVYTGWGNQPTVGIVIEDEAGNAVEITPASIIATADGQQDAANWQTYKGVFTTGDADANYILYFKKSETNQLQIAFGDFRLYTVVEVATVTLNKETIELKKGATEQLVAAVAPADATFQELAWVSDDEAVATVDDNGLVTAVAAGSATITATSVNGVKAECTVVVSDVDTDIQTITTNTETVIYDLAGRRVEKAVKGIYIVNGKKVIK